MHAWFEEYKYEVVGVKNLYSLAVNKLLLDSILGDRGNRSQRTNLGLALAKHSGRIYDGFWFEVLDKPDNRQLKQYQMHHDGSCPLPTQDSTEVSQQAT
jgi:hypothetical protein